MILMEESIEGFFKAFNLFVIMCAVMVPLWIVLPPLETTLDPVLRDFNAKVIATDDKTTTYMISFDKVRDCTPRPELFGWYVIREGQFQRVDVEKTNGSSVNISSNISLPVGMNGGIMWKVHNKEAGPFTSQTLIFYHSCLPFWNTKTVINIPN